MDGVCDVLKCVKVVVGMDDVMVGDVEVKENVCDGVGVGVGVVWVRVMMMDDLMYDGEIVVVSMVRELEEVMVWIEAFDARAGTTATTKYCGFDMEWKVLFKWGVGESKMLLV